MREVLSRKKIEEFNNVFLSKAPGFSFVLTKPFESVEKRNGYEERVRFSVAHEFKSLPHYSVFGKPWMTMDYVFVDADNSRIRIKSMVELFEYGCDYLEWFAYTRRLSTKSF